MRLFLVLFPLLLFACSAPGQNGQMIRVPSTTNLFMNSPQDGWIMIWNNVARRWSNGVNTASATNDAQPPSTTLTNLSATGAITNLNDNQFAGESTIAAISSGAQLSNIVMRAASGASRALMVNTNVLVVTNGNVGIGTDAPDAKLRVVGEFNTSNGDITAGTGASFRDDIFAGDFVLVTGVGPNASIDESSVTSQQLFDLAAAGPANNKIANLTGFGTNTTFLNITNFGILTNAGNILTFGAVSADGGLFANNPSTLSALTVNGVFTVVSSLNSISGDLTVGGPFFVGVGASAGTIYAWNADSSKYDKWFEHQGSSGFYIGTNDLQISVLGTSMVPGNVEMQLGNVGQPWWSAYLGTAFASNVLTRGIKLTGGQPSSSILRTDSGTNIVAATIGTGLSFDGTTLSATGSGGGGPGTLPMNSTQFNTNDPVSLISGFRGTNANFLNQTNRGIVHFSSGLDTNKFLYLDASTNVAAGTFGSGLTFSGGTVTAAAGSTNNPVQAVGTLILTNGTIEKPLDLGDNTNIVVSWNTNYYVASPSNAFTISWTGVPASTDARKIYLKLINTNASSGTFPTNGLNGGPVILLSAPSTNEYTFNYDTNGFWIRSGQMLTTGTGDTNVFNINPVIHGLTNKGITTVDGALSFLTHSMVLVGTNMWATGRVSQVFSNTFTANVGGVSNVLVEIEDGQEMDIHLFVATGVTAGFPQATAANSWGGAVARIDTNAWVRMQVRRHGSVTNFDYYGLLYDLAPGYKIEFNPSNHVARTITIRSSQRYTNYPTGAFTVDCSTDVTANITNAVASNYAITLATPVIGTSGSLGLVSDGSARTLAILCPIPITWLSTNDTATATNILTTASKRSLFAWRVGMGTDGISTNLHCWVKNQTP